MIGIIDYGMGNLRSVQKALERLGSPAEIVSQSSRLNDYDGLILPGVGAFRDAIDQLERHDFVSPLKDSVAADRPLLGICLGMQLLFERSFEGGDFTGLGFIAGDVVRFESEPGLKIPHMGWNALDFVSGNPLLRGIPQGSYVYFVHSYHVRPRQADVVTARTRHGSQNFVSIVNTGNLYATQFHPEKSQQIGLQLLKNFVDLVPSSAITA